MKNQYFLIFLCYLLGSCQSKYVKNLEKISGKWQVTKMEYKKNDKLSILVEKLPTMSFLNQIDKENPYGSRIGVEEIDGKQFYFTYSFDFSQNTCDLLFSQMDKKSIPITVIGRVQVYNFHFIDANTIELYTDKEYDYVNKDILYDVRYHLKR